MIFGQSGKERFGDQRQSFKFVAADRQRQYSDIDAAGAKAFQQNGGDFFHHCDRGLGKKLRESGENGRKKIRRDGGNHSYRDLPRDRGFALEDIAPSGFQLTQDRQCPGQKGFANFCETHGTA